MYEFDGHFEVLLPHRVEHVLPRHDVSHVDRRSHLMRHELERGEIEEQHSNQDEDSSSVHENERLTMDLMILARLNFAVYIVKVHPLVKCSKPALVLI